MTQLLMPMCPRARAWQQDEPLQRETHTQVKSSPCSPQPEKTRAQQPRPRAARNKNKYINKIFKIKVVFLVLKIDKSYFGVKDTFLF